MIRTILTLLLFQQCLYAQSYVDIVKIYGNTTSQNNFVNSASSTKINEFGVDVTYPILFKNNDAVITGLMVESTQLKLSDYERPTKISSYTLRLGLNKIHSERWSGTYLIIPKLASDFKISSVKNLQIGALGLLKYKKSDYANYKIGLYYNSELFGPFFVPILGYYSGGADKKFEANIMLPLLVDVNYKLMNWMNVGINFTGQIKSYRISSLNNSLSTAYIAKTTNEITGYLKFNFTQNIILYTRVGYSVLRSYREFKENDKMDLAISLIKIGNNRTQLNNDFSNGFLYQTILLYRFIQK